LRNRSRLGSLKCPQRLDTKPAAANISTAVKTSAVPFIQKIEVLRDQGFLGTQGEKDER
jgi:hypothetical protein